MENRIWTIGHSTRSIEEFVSLLKGQEITLLVDVRRFPGSRKWPHFNKENLEKLLKESGIEYKHIEALGGRRKADPDSKNIAWRNESFRAYSDYTETETFTAALDELKGHALKKNTAIMCSEAVWWRCHRSIISDYLSVQGWKVLHILSDKKVQLHPYTAAANIIDGQLSYKGIFGE